MLRKSIREAGRLGSYGLTPCLLFPPAPSTFLVLSALSSPLPPPLYHVASQALVCPMLTSSLWAAQDPWRGRLRGHLPQWGRWCVNTYMDVVVPEAKRRGLPSTVPLKGKKSGGRVFIKYGSASPY